MKTITGKYQHRISIQQENTTLNEYGERPNTWVLVCSIWAAVLPMTARQFMEAEGNQNEISHKITIRYRTGITPDMRVKFGNRYFGIDGIMNVGERNTELVLMCKELVGVE